MLGPKSGEAFLILRGGKIAPAFRPEDFGGEWPTDQASRTLHKWYEERYGGRLKTSWDVGLVAVRIRGSLWRGRIRTIYGRVRLCATRQPVKSQDISKGGQPLLANVLDSIDHLTPALRRKLTDDELGRVFEVFKLGYDAYYGLKNGASHPRLGAVFRDHEVAVETLVGDHRHLGLSRWSSLQPAEKVMKAAVSVLGSSPRRDHDLLALEIAKLLAAVLGRGIELGDK